MYLKNRHLVARLTWPRGHGVETEFDSGKKNTCYSESTIVEFRKYYQIKNQLLHKIINTKRFLYLTHLYNIEKKKRKYYFGLLKLLLKLQNKLNDTKMI